ncbi:MBL fold metallo-hydrolase [Candidatus Cytomitobacter primus]|uniref:Uncharacterized protein n=1 Tax=Candidatus Cytomitobacter primus TaxID=2066024 RepID=A0A5C0UF08_9PROT|nr:hypothetical protein [Candidatus Cytomitobacter primus]QEK38638.1 hypothetical protein FZC34_01810 [Candidatus Cytomitobacter primus]
MLKIFVNYLQRTCLMICMLQIDSVVEKSEFYIFNFGKGNCQLNKYWVKEDNSTLVPQRVGIMYDFGTTTTYGIDKDAALKALKGLNLLIVILSHPEQDHISEMRGYFSYLKQFNLVAFLCGDWNTKDTKIAKEVRLQYKDRSIEPYYWRNKKNEEHSNPAFFNGDIKELWDKAQAQLENQYISINENRSINEKIEKSEISEKAERYRRYLSGFDNIISELQNYVYIWSMNTNANHNAASPIISFAHKYGDKDTMSLLCTGDAENSTLNTLKDNLPAYLKEKINDQEADGGVLRHKIRLQKYPWLSALMQATGKRIDNENKALYALYDSVQENPAHQAQPQHSIICMAPHHGSGSTASVDAMIQLNNYFKVSAIIIPADFDSFPYTRWMEKFAYVDSKVFEDIMPRYVAMAYSIHSKICLTYCNDGDQYKLKNKMTKLLTYPCLPCYSSLILFNKLSSELNEKLLYYKPSENIDEFKQYIKGKNYVISSSNSSKPIYMPYVASPYYSGTIMFDSDPNYVLNNKEMLRIVEKAMVDKDKTIDEQRKEIEELRKKLEKISSIISE